MVAPIASAAGSFRKAIARHSVRRIRSSSRRSGARGAFTQAHVVPQLSQLGQWPTQAEVSNSLLASKIMEDSSNTKGHGSDWSEKHQSELLGISDCRGTGRAEASATVVQADVLGKENINDGEDGSSGGGLGPAASIDKSSNDSPLVSSTIDEDQCAAAVRAFLERVQQCRKAGRGDRAECTELNCSRLDPLTRERGDRLATVRSVEKSVSFDLGLSSVHDVVPYMEIYGRHPREFVFGRGSEMLPAGDRFGFVGLHESDEAEEADEAEDEPIAANSEDAVELAMQQEGGAPHEARVDDAFSPLCIHKVL